jgi:hypothetical protein
VQREVDRYLVKFVGDQENAVRQAGADSDGLPKIIGTDIQVAFEMQLKAVRPDCSDVGSIGALQRRWHPSRRLVREWPVLNSRVCTT